MRNILSIFLFCSLISACGGGTDSSSNGNNGNNGNDGSDLVKLVNVNGTYPPDTLVYISAEVSETISDIKQVDFEIDGQILNGEYNAPYYMTTWNTGKEQKNYNIRAKVTDINDENIISKTKTVNVKTIGFIANGIYFDEGTKTSAFINVQDPNSKIAFTNKIFITKEFPLEFMFFEDIIELTQAPVGFVSKKYAHINYPNYYPVMDAIKNVDTSWTFTEENLTVDGILPWGQQSPATQFSFIKQPESLPLNLLAGNYTNGVNASMTINADGSFAGESLFCGKFSGNLAKKDFYYVSEVTVVCQISLLNGAYNMGLYSYIDPNSGLTYINGHFQNKNNKDIILGSWGKRIDQ